MGRKGRVQTGKENQGEGGRLGGDELVEKGIEEVNEARAGVGGRGRRGTRVGEARREEEREGDKTCSLINHHRPAQV